jgi:hypothetical protein
MKKPSITRKIIGWLLGVIGTAITTLAVSILVPYIRDNFIGSLLPEAAKTTLYYLEFPLPAWSVVAAVAAFLVLRLLIRKIIRKTNPDAELFSYTTDTFGPWHFHWTWTRDRFGRRAIRNLSPICSVHDLILKKTDKELVCPKCRRVFPPLDRNALDHFRQTIAKKAAARYGVEL